PTPPRSPVFPYTTLFRSLSAGTSTNGYDGFGLTTNSRTFGYSLDAAVSYNYDPDTKLGSFDISIGGNATQVGFTNLDSAAVSRLDRKSTRLNSSHVKISY